MTPADEQDHGRQGGEDDRGPEVGLEEDEHDEDGQHARQEDQVLPVVDGVLLALEEGGQEQDQADLGQLGGLEAEAGEEDPAVGVGHGRHGQAEGEQEGRQAEKAVDEPGLAEERLADRDEESDDGQAGQGAQDLLDQEVEGLAVFLGGHEARGAEDEEDAEPDQEERDREKLDVEPEPAADVHRRAPFFRRPAARRRTSRLKVRPRSSKSLNMSQLVQAGARRTTSPRTARAWAVRTTSR